MDSPSLKEDTLSPGEIHQPVHVFPATQPNVFPYTDSDISDSDISDNLIPARRPLSMINPTSITILLPPRDPVTDYQRLVGSADALDLEDLVTGSTTSSNFEVSDYEGDCDESESEADSTTSCDDRSSTSSSPSPDRHPIAQLHPSTCHGSEPALRGPRHLSETYHSSDTLIAASHSSAGSVHRPTAREDRRERMSYVSRALALARPISPPPAYNRAESTPTVLSLRSYLNFAQVRSRPHSAPHFKYRPRYQPGDMTNEPYTLQATHVIQHPSGPPSSTSPLPGPSTLPPSTPSPFSRRRAENPTFGAHLLGGSTPPCSYNTRPGVLCRGECCASATPVPTLVIDTQVVNPEDTLPPPYTEGNFTSLIQAPRYSQVVNACYLRSNSFFHRNNAFTCMGSVRTLAIGVTLCCCGVVFLMVTYVFGAVTNVYLGYLGILQVIIGLTMIMLVAIYNSSRCDLVNLIKRARYKCPCLRRSRTVTSSTIHPL